MPLGYVRTRCVRLCLMRSNIACFRNRFAVFSESENMCSGAYSSFLFSPRHLTPTVYTSSDTSSIDIFTLGDGGTAPLGAGLGGTGGVLDGERTRPSLFRAFLNSDLRSVRPSAPRAQRRKNGTHP